MKTSLILVISCFLFVLIVQSVRGYEIPPRKIELRPYLNFFFPNNFWERESQGNVVKDKARIGFGLKVREQIKSGFGMVINASYTNVQTINDKKGDVVQFSAGGFYSKTYSFGTFVFDLSYGMITAAEEVVSLVLPSLEYDKPISARVSLSIGFDWPIANDWPRGFEFDEHYSTFSITLGTVFMF